MNGYWTAYNNFKTLFDAVKTLDDEKYEAEIGAGTVEAAVEAYAKAALEAVEAQLNGAFTGGKSLANMAADDTVDFSALVKENGTLKAFWEANKTNAKKGELFGAAVANIEKLREQKLWQSLTATKLLLLLPSLQLRLLLTEMLQNLV